MIAAIYARKSTEQHNADPETKSVARQIENARVFAAAKGWRVADAHVYADDAISGAETRKLVARQRLLDVISSGRPPFQVLIMRDASRFSRRDGDEAFGELKRLAQAGVEIWFYQDGTRFTFGSFGDNVVGFVRAEMNAEYRRQIARFTHEAFVRKAKAGHVTGGRVFGYDNERVDGHIERKINEHEAIVIRRIFALSADGTGYTRIAKQLNAEGVPTPRPQQGRPCGWSPSTVYEVLHRDLYRGEVVWNRTRKRNAEGQTAPSPRPESEWIRHARSDLRIVSDELWQAAHKRLAALQPRAGARGGRRRRDIDSKYLLSGFARCACCGGTLSALSRNHGSRRAYFYGCLAHSKRGKTVCENSLVLPVERVDSAVIGALVGDSLKPAAARAVLDGVFASLQPNALLADLDQWRRDLGVIEARIERLSEALEAGEPIPNIVERLRTRNAERIALAQQIETAERSAHLHIDRDAVEAKILTHLARWQDLLATDGRQVLREVLDGPLRFAPDGKRYRFEGAVNTGRIFTGLIGIPLSFLRHR